MSYFEELIDFQVLAFHSIVGSGLIQQRRPVNAPFGRWKRAESKNTTRRADPSRSHIFDHIVEDGKIISLYHDPDESVKSRRGIGSGIKASALIMT